MGLGYDTIEVEYEAWIDDVPLLSIDIDPPDVAPSVNLIHHVGGDLDASLARLAAVPPATNRWAAQALADHRRAFQQALRPNTNSFSAHAAIDAVRRALPRDGVLSFDVGAHTHQIASQWTAHAPKTFLITNGWSSMGFGLPGAIAAKLARPNLPVVCLIGDGCFQMTCGEVAAAKRLGLTLPIVVLDDKWLALIKVKQIRGSSRSTAPRCRGGLPRSAGTISACRPSACAAPMRLAAAVTSALSAKGPDRHRSGGRFRITMSRPCTTSGPFCIRIRVPRPI